MCKVCLRASQHIYPPCIYERVVNVKSEKGHAARPVAVILHYTYCLKYVRRIVTKPCWWGDRSRTATMTSESRSRSIFFMTLPNVFNKQMKRYNELATGFPLDLGIRASKSATFHVDKSFKMSKRILGLF